MDWSMWRTRFVWSLCVQCVAWSVTGVLQGVVRRCSCVRAAIVVLVVLDRVLLARLRRRGRVRCRTELSGG